MAQQSWIGQALGGRYRIEEILGQGGMSAVYKATDPNLNRVVAVKMIHPHLSDNPEFVVRFKEEAKGVAQLRHPNIVQVFDFDNQGDTFYMVLEFVPGETLQARLKRLNAADRQLPVLEAIEFGRQICDAAEYAHQRGMIHRDIKPANVMLDIHGQAILMDFGIAKIVGGQYHTATGATLGTAVYMSPEQIRGVQVDGRSDIYSIGVALFEMVSGRPPYEADSAMTLLMMHLNDPVPDLRQIRPDTPAALVAIIEKALVKDRDQRFQSAAEMATALDKLAERLRGGPIGVTVAEPGSPVEQPPIKKVAEPSRAVPASVPAAVDKQAAHVEAVAGSPARAQSSLGASVARQSRGLSAGDVASAAPPVKRTISPVLIAAGGAGIVVLLILAFVVGGLFAGGNDGSTEQVQDAVETATLQAQNGTGTALAAAPVDTSTAQPTATSQPTATAEPSATPMPPTATNTPTRVAPTATTEPPTATVAPTATTEPPTATVAPTATTEPPTATAGAPYTPVPVPTNTQPPGPYAQINRITIQYDLYIVDYQTIGFTETTEGYHTHFFFNTVPPEQAGLPGAGPWKVYYGPNPFTEYKLGDRPPSATQMCVRVANADHSLYYTASGTLDTGNCVALP